MSAVSLSSVKAHLNITTGKDDAELEATLARAEAILEKRVGPLGMVAVFNERHTGCGPFVLRKFPVVSVTSATVGGYPVADLDLDEEAGVLYGTFPAYGPRSVRITYMAGRSPLPADLEAAVLELVRHLWESQRGAASPSPFAADADTGELTSAGYLLPYRVQAMIEPHLLPPTVA